MQDPHGHLYLNHNLHWKNPGKISWRNARRVPSSVMKRIERTLEHHENAKILISGHGIGAEISSFRRFFGNRLEIWGLALTPIAPKVDIGDGYTPHLIEDIPFDEGISLIGSQKDRIIVDRQIIGNFPNVTLPEGCFDIIYDNHGPLDYTVFESENDVELAQARCRFFLNTLKDEGSIIFSGRKKNYKIAVGTVAKMRRELLHMGDFEGLSFYSF